MQHVINQILKEKIIIIMRGIPTDDLLPLTEALYEGGIRLVECTYNASDATTDAQIAANIGMLARHFEGRMLVGAGTVLTTRQVEMTKEAGGKFIISPDTNTEIIKKTKELGLVSIPGALTPSEVTLAHRSGADFIKLFPISLGGSDYLKALTAPLSHVKFLAVGGVNLSNMEQYAQAGACGFGMGTNFIGKKLMEEKDYAGITEVAKRYVANVPR